MLIIAATVLREIKGDNHCGDEPVMVLQNQAPRLSHLRN